MGMKHRSHWSKAGDVVGAWKRRSGLESERMLILHQVWEKEVGGFSRHWTLMGIRRGVLFVKVRSPAAAQELQLRGTQLVKSLNKYFKRSWIKGVRTTNG